MTPEPACQQISDQHWLESVYGDVLVSHGWWLEFRFFEDRPCRSKGGASVRFLRDFEQIVDCLESQRQKARQRAEAVLEGNGASWPQGLFWGVHPRHTRSGCNRDVAAFVSLCCDLDFKEWPELNPEKRPRAVWEKLHSAKLVPSVVVFTGHGFHCYWLLDEPFADKVRAEELQKAMAACFRGDHVSDSARLLRWPNSVNYKELDGGQSRAVRVVWWQPQTRYGFSALHEAFDGSNPTRPELAQEQSRPVWQRFFRCLDRDGALKALWNGQPCGVAQDDRSAQDMVLAHALRKHQLSPDDFHLVAAGAPWNSEKPLSRAYLERTWASAHRPRPTTPSSTSGELMLTSLPDSAWTDWAKLYREAVGPSTEAADEFHYVALITVLGAVLGKKVAFPCGRPVHPNIYAMLIGPTGDRTSTSAQLALDLLHQIAPELLVLNGVGSQEGLMERMAEADPGNPLHSRTLLYVDEMASFLKKGRRESSGSLLEFVTELFQGPDLKTHATRSKAIQLRHPVLSILAASTPAWLETTLDEDDILGGFTNRFVYVTAASKPDNPLPSLPDQVKLRSLVCWIREVCQIPERTLKLTPGAEKDWTDFYLSWRAASSSQDERARALLRRIDLYILKFASINAAMEGLEEVQSSHLSAAIDLGRFLAGCTLRVLGGLGEHKDCRLEKLIEQKLQAANGRMRRKQLRQLLGGRVTGEKLDRVLRGMERNGLISQLDPTQGQAGKLVQLSV